MKNTLKRLLIGTITLGSILVASRIGLIVAREVYISKNRDKVYPYIIQNKELIIDEVETSFNIEFDKVNNAYISKLEDSILGGSVPVYPNMLYNPEHDSIVVDTSHGTYVGLELEDVPPLLRLLRYATLKGSYIHELGHDFMYQIRNELLEKGELDNSHKLPFGVRDDLIEEGVAEYFAIESKQIKRLTTNKKWPKEYSEFHGLTGIDYYGYGYDLVKPILDSLGVKNGITAILSNEQINDVELYSPNLYQERITNGN